MDESIARALREPFEDHLVGKLPKLTCPECRKSDIKHCNRHPKETCDVCGNWISAAHTHLDYVGHADITDRFLSVDPDWNWEPVTRDVDPDLLRAAIETGNEEIVRLVLDSAPPKADGNGGLWMRVTIGGVTRLGYGDAPGKRGGDAVKVAIGDGLRNAGMRFGAGLDMWRKGDDGADTSPKPPEKQRTLPQWLDGMRKRIQSVESTQELQSLASEIEARVRGGGCEQEHYDELWMLGEARYAELQQREAEQPPPPPDAEPDAVPGTEQEWKANAFQARLEQAETLEALVALKEEVKAAFKTGGLNPDQSNKLLRGINTKQHAVGTAPQ
ncbi:hypothetical protein BJF79_47785 [Actinomadura sp. CNU-125]|uniref:hypothetical protein n=1 Tax=Actinomadura sp. CNU-125 TaxID=1904961 RepID=UPI00095C7FF2|nr:hypothetical protein [Actinomadura sp. CNU-125]OLT19411.1 hypothetical protein BJF79_47785 [Actinomadura sp. CNU-125]